VKTRSIRGWGEFWTKLKRMPRVFLHGRRLAAQTSRERGYVLFQEFLPGNPLDTRITVAGDRAWGYRRHVRSGDFRASGSGMMDYDREGVDPQCIEIAFNITETLRLQSAAFDFLFDQKGEPRIVELSYIFGVKFAPHVRGYWDRSLTWHEEKLWPADAILIDLLKRISQHRTGSATAAK
jgi:hypothetical protein